MQAQAIITAMTTSPLDQLARAPFQRVVGTLIQPTGHACFHNPVAFPCARFSRPHMRVGAWSLDGEGGSLVGEGCGGSKWRESGNEGVSTWHSLDALLLSAVPGKGCPPALQRPGLSSGPRAAGRRPPRSDCRLPVLTAPASS